MEDHHERKLQAHLNSLTPEEKEKWRTSASTALNNEHDKDHHTWDFIENVGKWLGVGSATAGGAGVSFLVLKRIARTISRH